jgi:hypothetical protein
VGHGVHVDCGRKKAWQPSGALGLDEIRRSTAALFPLGLAIAINSRKQLIYDEQLG